MSEDKKVMMGRVIQQTIFQKAGEVTGFLETEKSDEENFKGTSFDELVMDFENSIMDEYQILGKHIYGAGEFVFCTIFYVEKAAVNRKVVPAEIRALKMTD